MNQKDHKMLRKVELTEEEREAIKKAERRELIADAVVTLLVVIAAILATLVVMRTAP